MKWFCLMVIAWMAFVPECLSAPGDTFLVRSMYLGSTPGTWGGEILWRFSFHDDGRRITVMEEGKNSPVVEVDYGMEGSAVLLKKWIGGREIRETPSSPLLLSEGFPVPYDRLGPLEGGPEEVIIKKQADGTDFSYRVSKEVIGISLAEAVTSGMVDPARREDLAGRKLRLIRIKKDGNPLLCQFWAEGDALWLYEETPLRKSWRVSVSHE